MVQYINGSQEFYELVNMYPVIKKVLERFHFGFNRIKQGETVHDFFQKNCMTQDETNMILSRLNREIKIFWNIQQVQLI